MVDRAEAGIEGPWVPCFGGLSQQLGCCMAIPSKRTERVLAVEKHVSYI